MPLSSSIGTQACGSARYSPEAAFPRPRVRGGGKVALCSSRSWEAEPRLWVGTGGTCPRWCRRNGNRRAALCTLGPGTRSGLGVRRAEGKGVHLGRVEEEGGQADLRHQHQHGSWREGADRSLEPPSCRGPDGPRAPSRAGGPRKQGTETA